MGSYEQHQIAEIEQWKQAEPGVASKTFSTVTKPITHLTAKVIPAGIVQKAIDGFDSLSQNTLNKNDLLKSAQVSAITELKSKDLKFSDSLAQDVHNWATGMAGASGGVLGATGVGGIPLDLAALITLALRTIHKVGLCYGFESLNKPFVMGILAVSSAENRSDKKETLELITEIEQLLVQEISEGVVYDSIISKVVASGSKFTSREISRRLGQYLARRKSLQLIPVIGGVVSGATNIAFIADVSWAARRVCQEMWLIENNYVKNNNIENNYIETKIPN